jgi:hypothetical protein
MVNAEHRTPNTEWRAPKHRGLQQKHLTGRSRLAQRPTSNAQQRTTNGIDHEHEHEPGKSFAHAVKRAGASE